MDRRQYFAFQEHSNKGRSQRKLALRNENVLLNARVYYTRQASKPIVEALHNA